MKKNPIDNKSVEEIMAENKEADIKETQPDENAKVIKITRKQSFIVGIVVLTAVFILLGTGIFLIVHKFIENNKIYEDITPTVTEDGRVEYKRDTNEWYEQYIANLVMLDFNDFSDPNSIDMESLLKFGIWQAIVNDAGQTYKTTSKGEVEIPAKDVESFIRLHFKIKGDIEHQSITEGNVRYKHTSKMYAIPCFGYDDYYVPKIVKVEDVQKVYGKKLTVDYYNSIEYYDVNNVTIETQVTEKAGEKAPSDISENVKKGKAKPKKTVEIILTPNGKEYRFASLKTIKVAD